MEKSKYRDRAKEILWSKYPIWMEPELYQEAQIETMCQLAEEVEYNTNERGINSIKGSIYTRLQVEKLLQKQRELSEEQIPTNTEDWVANKIAIREAKLNIE